MNSKKFSVFFWLCVLESVLFGVHEFILNVHSDYFPFRFVLKFFLSAVPLFISFFSWKADKENFVLRIVVMFLFFLIGDVCININLKVGAAFFVIGHISFVASAFKYRKVFLPQILVWTGIIFLLSFLVAFFVEAEFGLKLVCVIYFACASAMCVTSFSVTRRFFIGSFLFLISDFLLVLNELHGETVLSHIISLGSYYVSVMILAFCVMKGKL